MTYLSNLEQSPNGSSPVGSDSWLAAFFVTGTNLGGYTLDSIQMSLTNGMGSPSDFTAMLYSSRMGVLGPQPSNSIATLNGSLNPVTSGVYTYTPGSTTALTPNTAYYIVVTAGTAIASGSYQWNTTTVPANLNGGWQAGGFFQSMNGPTWLNTFTGSPQFAIWATGVPEPSTWALLLTGAGLLYLRRCR